MIRRFQFENDIWESLDCLPMVARRKLDRAGMKLGLEQWQKLSRAERLMICHAPAETALEIDVLREFIQESAVAKSGAAPKELSQTARDSAEPPSDPPAELVANARTLGVALDRKSWDSLDSDERYALIKLGCGPRLSHNLALALNELVLPKSNKETARDSQIICSREPGK